MPERLVIANTSPLLYLQLVGRLDVLRALYGAVVVPPAVQTELEAGLKIKVGVPDVARLSWVEVKAVESQALIPAIVDLGPGEAEVIALGLEHPGSLLILDDLLARRVAALNSLTYTGTVGVLIKAKQGGHLGAIRPVIEGLRTSGLWLSDELVATVLPKQGSLRIPIKEFAGDPVCLGYKAFASRELANSVLSEYKGLLRDRTESVS